MDNSLNCADADMIVEALNDAKNEMSYSNWHNDKFDRLIKLVKKYCKENKIKKRFV